MTTLANLIALALIAAEAPKPADPPGPQEEWHLTLPDAIQIGLDNSEVVRVLKPRGRAGVDFEPRGKASEVVIGRINADAADWQFRAAILAHVRSVEQQYWALGQYQATVQSREAAVKMAEEILRRERADAEVGGRAGLADVAEAEQQLNNFKLNLVTATSDAITTERQLRNILGLPPADNRRIVPATAPTETKVAPTWESCLDEMRASHPEIEGHRRIVADAEFRASFDAAARPEVAPNPNDQLQRVSEHAQLHEVIQKATQSLRRRFVEVDADFKSLETARRLRDASQKRLDAQRAFYDEGRITVDRLLDAVGQSANALAQEAMFRASYNTAIAALEEAKGTLLARDSIVIVEPSKKSKARPEDDQVAPAAFDQPADASKSYKIRFQSVSPKVFEIDVEVRPAPR